MRYSLIVGMAAVLLMAGAAEAATSPMSTMKMRTCAPPKVLVKVCAQYGAPNGKLVPPCTKYMYKCEWKQKIN